MPESATGTPADTGTGPAVPKHILLVEDDENVGVSLAAVLEMHGWRVTLCTSVATALGHLREAPFDAVISDLMLDDDQGRTGFAVLAEATRLRPTILTILITGYPSAAVMDRAETDRLTGILVKPFEIHALRTLLSTPAQSGAPTTGK